MTCLWNFTLSTLRSSQKCVACLLATILLLLALAGCGNNAAPDSGSTQPNQTAPSTSETTDISDTLPTDTQWLCQSWCTLIRTDYDEYSTLTLRNLLFWDYGKGCIYGPEWIYWDPATGQEIDPVNEKPDTGTEMFEYTLEGDRLTLTFTENYIEDYEDYTVVYTVARSGDGKSVTFCETDGTSPLNATMFMRAQTDDGEYEAWFANLEEMCKIFSVECSLFPPDDTKIPTEPEASVTPPDMDWLVGTWSTLTRHDYGEYSTLYLSEFVLSDSGRGYTMDMEWTSLDVATGQPGDEWTLTEQGSMSQKFTYTLYGDQLWINFTGNDIEDYEDFKEIYTITRRSTDGTVMTLKASEGNGILSDTTYLRDVWELDYSLKDLCVFYDLDYSVPQPGNTETPTEPEKPVTPPDTDWLVGTWSALTRHDYGKFSGLLLWGFNFSEDGRGFTMDMEWISLDAATGQPGDKWTPAAHGSVSIKFTYTLKGDRLYVTFTGDDLDDFEDFTDVYTITCSADGTEMTLQLSDGRGVFSNTTYLRDVWDAGYSPEELCRIFGVDSDIPQPDNTEAPSIPDWFPGDWTTVLCDDLGEPGMARYIVTEATYFFGADGTGCANDMGWIGSPETGWEIAGKGFVESYFSYTLEGDTLTITHTGNEFEEYPEEYRETDVYTVVRNDDGSITWEDAVRGESRVYRRISGNLSVEELLLLFDLSPMIPKTE